MDLKNRKAYMDAIFERYHKARKESKTRILNENIWGDIGKKIKKFFT